MKTAVEINREALELFGGLGYTKEFTIEKQLRDSLGLLFTGGTENILKKVSEKLISET